MVHNTRGDRWPLAVGLLQSEHTALFGWTGGSDFMAPSSSQIEVDQRGSEEDDLTVTFTDEFRRSKWSEERQVDRGGRLLVYRPLQLNVEMGIGRAGNSQDRGLAEG